MKKILLLLFCLVLYIGIFGQRYVPVFRVLDSTKRFGITIAAKTLVFDDNSNKLWKLTASVLATDSLMGSAKIQIGYADNGVYFDATRPYNTNQLTVYGTSIYISNSNYAAGAWNASHWTMVGMLNAYLHKYRADTIYNGVRIQGFNTETTDTTCLIIKATKSVGNTKAIKILDNSDYEKLSFLDNGNIVGWRSKLYLTNNPNLFFGESAGSLLTSGTNNLGFGGKALENISSGTHNFCFGVQAGSKLTTTNFNFLVGYRAGLNLIGSDNIMIGYNAGVSHTSANDNIFIGRGVAENSPNASTGSGNIAIGASSLHSIKSGAFNIVQGYSAGAVLNDGNYNILQGLRAGYSLVDYDNNIMIGYNAGYNTTRQSNIFIGYQAGYNNGASLGSLAIGYQAGWTADGNWNVFLGAYSGYNETGSNKLHIANNSARSLIYGEFDNFYLKIDADSIRTTGKKITVDSLSNIYSSDYVVDDGTYALPGSKSGWGFVQAGNDEARAKFYFKADGTVTLSSADILNSVNTDSDTYLCIYDGGSNVIIKNRLGSNKKLRYEIHYSL